MGFGLNAFQDWLTKPDGNPGWASYFLGEGYEVYLVDLPYRGRSAWHPKNGTMTVFSAEQIQMMFTACKDYKMWPQAADHNQWPGAGVMGDPIFDQFYASTIQMVSDPALQESASQAACAALLDRIQKPVILISHSAGAPIPLLVADVRKDLVKAIISLEPVGPPFFKATFIVVPGARYGVSSAPITYDPPVEDPDRDLVKATVDADPPLRIGGAIQAEDPPPRQLVNLVGIPILVVTAEASYHAPYDWITVRYLRQAGLDVEHLQLSDVGKVGNGHMMFLEKNSDHIAAEIDKWIKATAGGVFKGYKTGD